MWILDFLVPPSCVFCGIPTHGAERCICIGCSCDLPWNEPPVSPVPGIFEASIAMLQYAYPVDIAIMRFKFGRKLYYGAALGEVLCTAAPLLPRGIDAVLPVPLHWRRRAWRGFNQATELAKPLARLLKVPILRSVRRRRATPFQSGLNAVERARNLREAFVVRETKWFDHVLIIDDVLTTGATTTQLAKVLQHNGVARVSRLVVAKAKKDR